MSFIFDLVTGGPTKAFSGLITGLFTSSASGSAAAPAVPARAPQDQRSILSSIFSSQNGSGGPGSMVRDHNGMLALTGATALAYADGEDGAVGGTIEFAADSWALNAVLSGEDTMLANAWLAYRMAKVFQNQTGMGALGQAFVAAVSYFGIDRVENNLTAGAQHQRLALAAPTR